MTPEGKVKQTVQRALAAEQVLPFSVVQTTTREYEGFYYMPVAGRFSVLGIHDFVGCWKGVFFSLETKAPDATEDETHHQGMFRVAVTNSGGIALTGVRDGAAAVAKLKELVEETLRGRKPV